MRDKLLFAREAGEWTCDDDGCFVVLDGDAAPRPASRAELDAAALSTRAVDLKSSDAVQALLDESSSLYNIDECIVIYNDDNEPEIVRRGSRPVARAAVRRRHGAAGLDERGSGARHGVIREGL